MVKNTKKSLQPIKKKSGGPVEAEFFRSIAEGNRCPTQKNSKDKL
jgi:hypothetical protein